MEHKPLEKYKLELKELVPETPKEYTRITCPACDSEVPADHININDKIAKCGSCNAVFPFQKEIASLIEPKKIKQEVIRPEGIDIFYYEDELDLTVQQPYTAWEVLGVVFIPLFAALFTLASFKKGISIFLPGIFWLLSAYPIWSLAGRSRHKVRISINNRNLTVRWRPKKFVKDKSYHVDEIDQIYVKNIHGQGAVYMIVNGVEGQKHVQLIQGLDSMSKARYLEQEIEQHLGIMDRKVPEETS